MHPNQNRLVNFYAAFARLDADAMAAFYEPNAQFDDEVFSLHGHEAINGMWRMLCEATQAKNRDDWKLTCRSVEAGHTTGKAQWESDYRFSASGRKVHCVVNSEFEFNDAGLITRHRDRFDFWSWSRKALGVPGLVLGWTPFFRRMVRTQAAANLEKYLAKRRIQ